MIAAVEHASKLSSSRRVHYRHVCKPSTAEVVAGGRVLARAEGLDVAGKTLRAAEKPAETAPNASGPSRCLLLRGGP
jgi:hypothetical protein